MKKITNFGNIKLVDAKENSKLFNDIFKKEAYTRDFYIPKGSTVIDIGANVGIFSIYASKNAERVLAFEPYRKSFNILKENLRLNNIKNVFPFNEAVFDKQGKAILSVEKMSTCNTLLTRTGIVVKKVSLKDIFDKNNIQKCNFLKIDTEGSEQEILKNLPRQYFRKIDKIALEYHNTLRKNDAIKTAVILSKSHFKLKEIRNQTLCSNLRDVGIILAKKSSLPVYLLLARAFTIYFLSRFSFKLLFDRANLVTGIIGKFIKLKFPKIYKKTQ